METLQSIGQKRARNALTKKVRATALSDRKNYIPMEQKNQPLICCQIAQI